MNNRNEIAQLHADIVELKELNRLQRENDLGGGNRRFTEGRMEQIAKERAAIEFRRKGGTLY